MPQLEKASFTPLTPQSGSAISVMYNPTELAVKKGVEYKEMKRPGKDAPKQQFTAGKARTLSIKLDFDTSGLDGTTPDADDVRKFTDPIALLAHKPASPANAHPPRVLFAWGQGLKMTGVITSLSITYTRFNANGVPTRANVQIELLEDADVEYANTSAQQAQQVTIREVQDGQTLAQASGATSDQQQAWRDSAQGDENPRRPATGPRPT